MRFQGETIARALPTTLVPPLLHIASPKLFCFDFNKLANVGYRNNHDKFDSSVDELTMYKLFLLGRCFECCVSSDSCAQGVSSANGCVWNGMEVCTQSQPSSSTRHYAPPRPALAVYVHVCMYVGSEWLGPGSDGGWMWETRISYHELALP